MDDQATRHTDSTLERAVFLDRDDTLIENRRITADTPFPGDLFDPDKVSLLPGAADACLALKHAGFGLIVVTNQGSVARGRCTEAQVSRTNERLEQIMEQIGAPLDAVYYCPFNPKGTTEPYNTEHAWRKPAPGMVLEGIRRFSLDPARCWLIGDAPRDIEAGCGAGLPETQTLLIGEHPDARFADLAAAADFVIRETRPTR